MLATQHSPTPLRFEPLTAEEQVDLRARFSQLVKLVGERNQTEKELEELRAEKALLAIREAQLDQQIAEARILKEKAQAMQAEGRAMQAEGHATRVEAQALKASGEQKLQSADVAKKKMVTQIFYAMFNGTKPLPVDQIDTLFSTYLVDGSIFIDMSIRGPRLTSMRSVIQYIEDHPDVKMCNFKPFKTALEDIPTLADYIAQLSCRIRAIGINRNISDEAKSSLEAAVAARKGALKVQFLDS